MEVHAMRLHPHHDLKKYLDNWARENKVKAACIISCVGSLEKVCIRFAGKKELTILEGKFEIISLTGTISLHGSHLHISIADENGRVTGAHLKEGSLVNTTAEVIIGMVPGFKFGREWDDATGFEELKIEIDGS